MSPDVSVVIPTYNRRKYLEQAIQSCFDGNEGIDVEVIVVDDGSTDGTRDYLQALDESDERVQPFFQQHQGPQVARNRGMEKACGEFIKFLDDDDWLAVGGLSSEVEVLRDSGADLCYGSVRFIDENGDLIAKSSQDTPRDLVASLLDGAINTFSLKFTFHRTAISNQTWRLELPARQDVAFLLSVAAEEPTHTPSNVLVGHMRWHSGPRVSRTAGKQHDTVLLHAQILLNAIQKLQGRGTLTPERCLAGAKGLWRWAHMVAAYDLNSFKKLHQEIQRLVPGYLPERPSRLLSRLDALWGPHATERLTFPLRRAKMACGRIIEGR